MEMFFFQKEVIVFASGSFTFLILDYVSIFLSHRDPTRRKIKQKLNTKTSIKAAMWLKDKFDIFRFLVSTQWGNPI